MASYKPKNSKKVKRYSPKKGGKVSDRKAIHKQNVNMADIISDVAGRKKKGAL